MDNVLVIIGPTASGKTKLAIEIAKRANGEIISADSMQIYKYMDIGTAKPDEEEKEGIKHYLIDEVTPDEEFSVARFKELALKYIDEILSKGKLPIVAGGTGLYINSLIYNLEFSDTICDWELRKKLEQEAKEKGNEYLHNKLKEIDPKAAEKNTYEQCKKGNTGNRSVYLHKEAYFRSSGGVEKESSQAQFYINRYYNGQRKAI